MRRITCAARKHQGNRQQKSSSEDASGGPIVEETREHLGCDPPSDEEISTYWLMNNNRNLSRVQL